MIPIVGAVYDTPAFRFGSTAFESYAKTGGHRPDDYPHVIPGAGELPSLAKEGWTRHQINGPVPLKSAARSVSPAGRNIKNGVVRSTSDNRWLERTTLPCFALSGSHSLRSCPSAPAKEASLLFLNGRSHPSFAKEGSSIRML